MEGCGAHCPQTFTCCGFESGWDIDQCKAQPWRTILLSKSGKLTSPHPCRMPSTHLYTLHLLVETAQTCTSSPSRTHVATSARTDRGTRGDVCRPCPEALWQELQQRDLVFHERLIHEFLCADHVLRRPGSVDGWRRVWYGLVGFPVEQGSPVLLHAGCRGSYIRALTILDIDEKAIIYTNIRIYTYRNII